jgi:predicted transcriptional regulator|tara:strand:+ start:1613 stop:1882 length:270 start_codon:yes stop_codon:yes gene_type:complete
MELNKQQIQRRLKELGVTQREIAHNTRVKEAHITNVIAGKRKSQRIVNFLSLIFGEDITIQETKAKVTVKPINHTNTLQEPIDNALEIL